MKFLRRPNHLSIVDLFLSFIFSCSVLRVFWLVLLGVIKLIFISVILDGFIINPLSPIILVFFDIFIFNLFIDCSKLFVSCGNVLIVFLFIILLLVLLSNITTGLLLSLITVVNDVYFFFRDSPLPYPTFSHPYLFTIRVLSINKSSVISLFLVILKYA